jgi:peptidoglycan/xylan/chitin deacetylase (PgdA/CDA1 family)
VPASFSPPAGLAVDSVPLFVVMGFDDNCYADGMEWLLGVIKDKKNPKGTENPETFDNLPVNVAFNYISGALDQGGEALLNVWKKALAAGYEVGDHTIKHETGATTTLATWRSEIAGCRTTLSQKLGIPESTIVGFRTPYLAFNDATFTAVSQEKFLYECTMTQMQDYNKSQFFWPYTLNDGFPDKVISGWTGKTKIPGLWEMPVYTVGVDATMWPPITGFDSSILTQACGSQFEAMLKNGIDYRLKAGTGNRAPMTVGLHTDTYSPTNPAGVNYDPALKLAQRQAALVGFITYALTKPMVRFVSPKQLIDWMRKPVPLGRKPPTSITNRSVASVKMIAGGVLRANCLKLFVTKEGLYSVRVSTSAGRIVVDNAPIRCMSGLNTLMLGNKRLAAGAYLVSVAGNDLVTTMKLPLQTE